MTNYIAQNIRRAGDWHTGFEHCVLTYDDRFLRRKVVRTVNGGTVLVDLKHTVSLNPGDAFELTDGRYIGITAAKEPLFSVTGQDLTRLAWHIGNRHTPCQIGPDRLVIQQDHVIREMLERLDASVAEIFEPFLPEGGAYGYGRTHGHNH
ncbi:urease accessory protein [Rhodovulum imhoffii]|uniref:Urease accessory protein UreE n=1 Tax=Rhodovulum imhoffii TaxID=365340 RepID=A0A2T5BTV5_9RHOB|nr:urease accessory protein UreE [Rhodovulum imhoffii]MBK5933940.1 urease accessory protein UreE [Rhodovulum imhoffii]PTN02900.1 urease accessory protein [Rhodovulum imhoffii]